MEQLDMFAVPVEDTAEKKGAPLKKAVQPFKLEPGTLVNLRGSYSTKYKVISDNGRTAIVQYESGYLPSNTDEQTIKSMDITAIVSPDYLPLPTIHRPHDLNPAEYTDKEADFWGFMLPEERQDMILYKVLLSGSHNGVDELIQMIKEDDMKSSLSFCMFYGSSYLEQFGPHDPLTLDFCGFNDKRSVTASMLGSTSEYDTSALLARFRHMVIRISTIELSEMNPFELMAYYRLFTGFRLRYRIETDEWFIRHPYGFAEMPVKEGRPALNDSKNVIRSFEIYARIQHPKKVFKEPFSLLPVGPIAPESGFQLPHGARVSVGGGTYWVIEDDGEHVLLSKDEEGDETITFKSRAVYYATHNNSSVFLPLFHRPASMTLEGLMKQEADYYANLSDKELADRAVLLATRTNTSTMGERFDQAMMENNEPAALSIIQGHMGGHSSGLISSEWNNKDFTYSVRLANTRYSELTEDRIVAMNTKQIVAAYKQMVENTRFNKTSALSLAELQLAYLLRGYKLEYSPTTNEYKISRWFGIKAVLLTGGREMADNLNGVIHRLEEQGADSFLLKAIKKVEQKEQDSEDQKTAYPISTERLFQCFSHLHPKS